MTCCLCLSDSLFKVKLNLDALEVSSVPSVSTLMTRVQFKQQNRDRWIDEITKVTHETVTGCWVYVYCVPSLLLFDVLCSVEPFLALSWNRYKQWNFVWVWFQGTFLLQSFMWKSLKAIFCQGLLTNICFIRWSLFFLECFAFLHQQSYYSFVSGKREGVDKMLHNYWFMAPRCSHIHCSSLPF